MQLVPKRSLANDKLRRICPIEAVDTVCPANPILQCIALLLVISRPEAVMKEACCVENIPSDSLKGFYDVLVTTKSGLEEQCYDPLGCLTNLFEARDMSQGM